jgi:hypothetical protein
MIVVGFKLPHLATRVPRKYYDPYSTAEIKQAWKLSDGE